MRLTHILTTAGEGTLLLVATADGSGLPHVAAARSVRVIDDVRIGISEWFCPGTLDNLSRNRLVSVVTYRPRDDSGHQILGEVEKIEDLAILDGEPAGELPNVQPPQVERELVIRVDRVLAFSQTPHSDVEEPF